jgi:hypothetical protein
MQSILIAAHQFLASNPTALCAFLAGGNQAQFLKSFSQFFHRLGRIDQETSQATH